MSGIENAVQAPPVQHVQSSDAPARAEGLGQTHSIGKTVARVIGAIFSLGISELVIAIIDKVKSASVAPAQPHLPGNFELQQLKTSVLNQDCADGLDFQRSLMIDLRQIRDNTFEKFCSNLGLSSKLDTIENDEFKERLQQSIKNSQTPVEQKDLPDMARSMTEQLMAEKFLTKIYDESLPSGLSKQWVQSTLQSDAMSSDMRSLLHPAEGVKVGELREQLRAEFAEKAHIRGLERLAINQLYANAMTKFCSMTGLSQEQAKQLNLGPLENKFTVLFKDLRGQGINTVEGFVKAHTDRVNTFFTQRAEAYTSITRMAANGELEPHLAAQWQNKCLTLDEEITPNCFEAANAAAKAISLDTSLASLSSKNTNERIATLDKMTTIQQEVRNVQFKESTELGIADKTMRTVLVIDALLHRSSPNVIQQIVAPTDRNKAFSALLSADWTDKSDGVEIDLPPEELAQANQAMFQAFGRMEFYEMVVQVAKEGQWR